MAAAEKFVHDDDDEDEAPSVVLSLLYKKALPLQLLVVKRIIRAPMVTAKIQRQTCVEAVACHTAASMSSIASDATAVRIATSVCWR